MARSACREFNYLGTGAQPRIGLEIAGPGPPLCLCSRGRGVDDPKSGTELEAPKPTSSPMPPVARWTLHSQSPSLARSSHCLSVTPAGRAFLYGGELTPRTPVDSHPSARGSIYSLDLSVIPQSTAGPGGLSWVASAPTPITPPDPRVGAASVTIAEYFYLWGGRGGVDMLPLSIDQAGVWRCSLGAQTAAPLWERIAATNEENAPQVRSYHTMINRGVRIFFRLRLFFFYILATSNRRIQSMCMQDAPRKAASATCMRLI